MYLSGLSTTEPILSASEEWVFVFDGKLHQVYNWRKKGITGISEYDDFKNMMVEIGAVGKVEDETDRCIIGHFEYTEPHKLLTILGSQNSIDNCLIYMEFQIFRHIL